MEGKQYIYIVVMITSCRTNEIKAPQLCKVIVYLFEHDTQPFKNIKTEKTFPFNNDIERNFELQNTKIFHFEQKGK